MTRKEQFNPLKELKEEFEGTSPCIPDYVVHSHSRGRLPDGLPVNKSRVRRGFITFALNCMESAVRHNTVTDPGKKAIMEAFREYVTEDIGKRPPDLVEIHEGVMTKNPTITSADIGWTSRQIIGFLSGTEYEIKDPPLSK